MQHGGAGRARQDRAHAARLPARGARPAGARAGTSTTRSPSCPLAVTSPTRTLRELSTLTDQVIVKRFQNVPGVGQVRVSGSVARQILVNLRPAQMHSQSVGVDEIVAAIRAANMDVPAGQDRPRPHRAAGAHRGPDQGARGLRQDHRGAPRQGAGLPGPGRRHRGRRARGRLALAHQRPAGPHPPGPQGAGRQHRRGGQRREGGRRRR